MARRVRGTLFVDYVRMLRACPDRSWMAQLPPEDLRLIEARVDPAGWYPMETFERLGLAILEVVAGGDLQRVREWGRVSAAHVAAGVDGLALFGDPRESVMRFQVFRRTFFDFEALGVVHVYDGTADLTVDYGMSPRAEEAAAVQTLGFFVGLVELTGGRGVRGFFSRRAWAGDGGTVLSLAWQAPAVVAATPASELRSSRG